MLKRIKISLFLLVFIGFPNLSWSLTCNEVLERSERFEKLTDFFEMMERNPTHETEIQSLILEISQGTSSHTLNLPGMVVKVETYHLEGSFNILVREVNSNGLDSLTYQAQMRTVTYALLKAAQAYRLQNPETTKVNVSLPRSADPDVVLMQRVLGFLFAGNTYLFFGMGVKDMPIPQRFGTL